MIIALIILHKLSIDCSFFKLKEIKEWSYAISAGCALEIVLDLKLQRNLAKYTTDIKYASVKHHTLDISLSFLSLTARPPADRKWPGSVEGAEHDRTPALFSPWCHTHYGPFINNPVPVTNVPSSPSCQHTNKPWFNDPWHHICLCVGVWKCGKHN